MGTRESVTLMEELDAFHRKVFYRDLWRWQYANRCFVEVLKSDTEASRAYYRAEQEILELFSKRYSEGLGAKKNYLPHYIEFVNSLVHSYHIETQPDGFWDAVYDSTHVGFGRPFNRLSPIQRESVAVIHEWTHKLGFLSVLLAKDPSKSNLLYDSTVWDWFVEGDPDKIFSEDPILLYRYPKKDHWPIGIQVSTEFDDIKIKSTWDLAIYFHDGDAFSRLSKLAKTQWKEKGKIQIGDERGAMIKLYVDRMVCSHNKAVTKLEDLIFWLKYYRLGGVYLHREELPGYTELPEKVRKKIRREDRKYLRAVTNSEEITSSRWSLEKSNLRRAIGLYHWDAIHTQKLSKLGKSELIRETIEDLKAVDSNLINFYHSGYNRESNNKGQSLARTIGELSPEANATVHKEMRNDYLLTDYCIKNGDFFDFEKARKSW